MKDTKTGTYQAKVHFYGLEGGMKQVLVLTEATTVKQAEKMIREYVVDEFHTQCYFITKPLEINENVHGRAILNGMRDWYVNLIMDMETPIEYIKTLKKKLESAETVNTHELARIAEIYEDAMNYTDLVKVVCEYASSIGKDDD